MSQQKFISDIQKMLMEAIPDCEISDTSSELINDMLIYFMNDIIKRIGREKQDITSTDIIDVIDNTPEFSFLRNSIPK